MNYRRNQKGGAVRMPARYYDDKNLFSGPNCQSCGPTKTQTGGCGCGKWADQEGGAVRMPARYYRDSDVFSGPKCGSKSKSSCGCGQKREDFSTGAPFYMWSQGAPLKYTKPFRAGEGPVFDPIPPNNHW
jgi:hypothetical protein